MKFSRLKPFILLLSFTLLIGCSKSDDNSNSQDASIIGKWQLYGNTKYALEFTNYGIAIWKHTPYVNTNLDYVRYQTVLTVSEKTGIAILSNNGNTLQLTGFADPSASGAPTNTSAGPNINGVYIRQ